ncbi:MAG: BlaI/MecI/CopY family transcriptional regulator [Actinobacteria bacterium]|nr:BlaI/MecI/CopY family transcriptional regulator [Actinomycetota bacterium]
MARVGELEAAVMDSLWACDVPMTVRQVLEELAPSRPLAYTTVMTVMERLFRKGLLTRESDGRAYAYTPAQSRADYTAATMTDVLAAAGDRSAALIHFAGRLSAKDTRQLLAALQDRQATKPPGRR